MTGRLRFPIRWKILVTLLLVVTGVVGAITLTMANLFHEDKKAYIKDLVSMVSIATAEECRSTLVGYEERLQVYARVIAEPRLDHETKTALVGRLFEDFPELIAVSVDGSQGRLAAAYNEAALAAASLTRQDLLDAGSARTRLRRLPARGESFVENSTLSPELPTMTLTARQEIEGLPEPVSVSAVLRLDALRRIARRARGLEVFIADSTGTLLAHPDQARVARRERIPLSHDVLAISRGYNAGLTREYVDDGQAMIAGIAGVSFGQLVAGARIQKSAAYLASRDLLENLLAIAAGLLLLATFVGLFWARRVTRPIERLSEATRSIARGRFDVHLRVASSDEIGALADSFNQMVSELKHREAALHEAQAQLVQSEKLAAFGQLGAGIAHEVKNPLAGILGCTQLSLRKVEPGTPIEKNLQLIEKETRRCKAIIENLLRFARQEKAVMEPMEINPTIGDAIAIVGHQLGMSRITLEQDLAEDLPQIHGNANQLQQVLMNLMMNAQQALAGEGGTIAIRTRRLPSGQVEVRVTDSGPGIPEELRGKIFEPFFTTKPQGQGTGLGLSVSFGIIKDHGGEITVESAPGRGAAFVVTLPALQRSVVAAYAGAAGA